MYNEITQCRISGSKNLITVLSLGEQYLTGVFPKSREERVTKGPLELVWCADSCLLQLKQSFDLSEMYGDNYGYRSGLNMSMVNHLTRKIKMLEDYVALADDDIVVDIGSNDATSLKAYTKPCKKVGIDPTGDKFRNYYPKDFTLISDFFSSEVFMSRLCGKKAKIVTAIAMFYDLEDPIKFVMDISAILADDGIWHFEQSYMPSMLRLNSYDTICHEHLEFYSLKVVKDILAKCGLRIIDVAMNAVNGGSFAVTACKMGAAYRENTPLIDWLLKQEEDMGLDTPRPYRDFENRVYNHRKSLVRLLENLVGDGKKIIGYGASTKGNVLLQFCGLTQEHVSFIADVNEDKFGCFTPGTHIPIISEKEAKAMKPDYFLVLPWHFKAGILEREREYINNGGKFIFPFPEIEVV